jgi:hypothetical protein
VYDAVLDRDSYPIYEGTPEETKGWLQEHPKTKKDCVVVVGTSTEMVSVPEYFAIDE